MAYVNAAVALQAGGGLMGAMGAQNEALSKQATFSYKSQVAQNNAQIAQMQAGMAIQIGQQQEEASRLKTGQVFGAQRAAMAANGIDLGEGSATDVLTTTKFMGEHDALTIRDNAMRSAWGYQVQAQNYTNEASFDSAMKDSIDPTMAAVSSLLGSAGQVAGNWYQYNKSGASSGASSGAPNGASNLSKYDYMGSRYTVE